MADCGPHTRLIFKMTEILATRVGQYVALQENGKIAVSFNTMNELDNYYDNRRELKLNEV